MSALEWINVLAWAWVGIVVVAAFVAWWLRGKGSTSERCVLRRYNDYRVLTRLVDDILAPRDPEMTPYEWHDLIVQSAEGIKRGYLADRDRT